MKRVIFITLFCFLIIQKGVSQSYYNKRIDFYGSDNLTNQFLIYNDTFYLSTQLSTSGRVACIIYVSKQKIKQLHEK
jgi:hypothetical protein